MLEITLHWLQDENMQSNKYWQMVAQNIQTLIMIACYYLSVAPEALGRRIQVATPN